MNTQVLQHNHPRAIYACGLILFLFSVNTIVPLRAWAQNTQWSPPQTIPDYDLGDSPPILIADGNRTVHAFTTQWLPLDGATSVRGVIYSQWSLESGWRNPIDILLSPVKEARITDVYLDGDGMFHAVFFGGDHTGADIYYSKAPAARADDARSWSTPIIIGADAGDPEAAVFVEDNQGTLHVIYYGNELGNGLYEVHSGDGGENWSNSTPIFFTQSDEPVISLLHVIKAESGSLHAIWNVYNIAGQGRGIYYARSQNGIEWSAPVLLADAQDGLGTQTPTIIEYNETLIALYNMTPKITMRRSTDDGKTWDDPSTIFPRHVGVNGSLSLVIDGDNKLHLFFGQRITGSPDIHGMWHSILVNSRWTEPTAVVKGPRVVDTKGLTGFDPYDARAVVSQGNVILVTWRTDPGDIRDNGVWFSYTRLSSPELPVATLQPLDTITAIASPLPSPTLALPEGTDQQIILDRERQKQSPFVWVGVAVVIISVFGVFYMLSDRRVQ